MDSPTSWTRPLAIHEKLRAARSDWEAQWTHDEGRPLVPTREFVASYLAARPAEPDDTIMVTADEVRRRVEQARNKATGVDGWSAAALLLLPKEFWEAVVYLWRAMLRWSRVPKAWKDIRIALIEKPDGGYRPLSIGAVLWRALGSACCRRLRGWTHAWATEELQGGIAERGIHGVHDALIADLEAVAECGGELAGIKTDLRRCFDMVRPFQALDVCAHLGMPAALVSLIADYYVEQRRFLSLEGQADFNPIMVTRGLQQGCPYSVILVNAVAQVWVAAVKQQVPDVTIRCYLDDRTTWTRKGGQEAAQSLVRAVEAGSVVDLHFDMMVHPGKRACFGTSARVREHLSRFAASLGSPCSSFKLLGVAYNMVKGRTVPNVEDLTEKIQLRCDRVAGLARALKLRRALLRTAVVALIAWAGPWQQYAKAHVKKWISAADNALWGRNRPRLRSRLLGHSVVGSAESNVDFSMAFAVVRYEWHRAEAQALGAIVPAHPGARWKDLCVRWGWTYQNGVLETLVGTFIPGLHTLAAVKNAAKQAWLQELWDMDVRTQGSGPLARRTPILGGLQKVANRTSREAMRVATACALDGADLERAGIPNNCRCGLESPTARHLTFECPLQLGSPHRSGETEERLLLKLMQLPDKVDPDDFMGYDEELISEMEGAANDGSPIIAATGGGCFVKAGMELWQRAAWAVVVRRCGSTTTLSGLVPCGEQTPAAAERHALWHFLRHVRRVGCKAIVFVDNQAAVRRLHRAWNQNSWRGPLQRFWREAAAGLQELVTVIWIPSHGKREGWEAPAGVDVATARELNDLADCACRARLAALRPAFDAAVQYWEEAVRWSIQAAEAQVAATAPYGAKVRSKYGQLIEPEI